jgi:adenylosuccinate lyase
VLEAHAEAGVVPADAVEPVRNAPPPTPEAVDVIEQVTQHDVIAFLSAWADNTEPRSAAAYVHFGMTSSDLLDTALAVQLCEATDILLGKLDSLVAALRDLGLQHRGTVKVGRTHGVHAEPDTFGHTVANFAFAMARSRDRLRQARQAVAVAKISGAVGTYSNIDNTVEAYVGAQLGLAPAPAATQVVIRDGISEWVSALAIVATVCDAIALEVRHGQRTEVASWRAFRQGPEGLVGHAAQEEPHPVRADLRPRACRARPDRAGDGRHPAVARAGHQPLERRAGRAPGRRHRHRLPAPPHDPLVTGLVVDADRMRANLDATGGLIYTSAVLLELVEAGLSARTPTPSCSPQRWRPGSPACRSARRCASTPRPSRSPTSGSTRSAGPSATSRGSRPVFDRLAALS